MQSSGKSKMCCNFLSHSTLFSLSFNLIQLLSQDTLPDGTYVPAGVLVCYSPYVLGRNPQVWDSSVYKIDDFHPERWIERSKLPNEYAYPHFNAGRCF